MSWSEEISNLIAPVRKSGIYLHYLSIAPDSVNLPVLNHGRSGLRTKYLNTGACEPDMCECSPDHNNLNRERTNKGPRL